ncbi:conserved hypothetical protein, secreted [Candidatus Magnetomorum sp. HK-1]|nr:conserved hypothetical protein, secreted [Candidatus Magnetomorum sp. HK-1]
MKTFVCIFSLILFWSNIIFADTPRVINFQGFIVDSSGEIPEDNTYKMTFSLWDEDNESTGIKLWEETHLQVIISRGIYSVALGSVNPFPVTLTFASTYYMGVQVNDGELMKNNNKLLELTSTWTSFRAITSGGHIVNNMNQNSNIQTNDDVLMVQGSITMTLPLSSSNTGKVFTLKNVGTDVITVNASGADTIDGKTTLTLPDQYGWLSVISDGNSWNILNYSVSASLTTNEIQDNAITSSLIANETITNTDISASANISDSKLSTISTPGKITDSALSTNVTLLGQTIDSTELADASINTSKLAGSGNAALTNGANGNLLSSNADGTFSWTNLSISTDLIIDSTITNTDISASANISDSKLSTISTPGKITDSALSTNVTLLGQTIDSTELADASISTSKLAGSGYVSLTKGTSGNILSSNGDGTFSWATADNAFSVSGNTVYGGSFTDTFIFGEDTADGDGNKMFFNGSKGAFRAGRNLSSNWDQSNVGNYSSAFGESTKASGLHSTAFGQGTTADQDYMMAIGKYNTASNSNALFAVGNGSAGSPSDAFVVKSDGNAVLSGEFTASNFNQPSDERLKNDIHTINNALKKLEKINGIMYQWQNETKPEGVQFGVIAQELQEIFPELVKEDDSGYLSVNYIGLIPVLIEAVKEQQVNLKSINQEIEKLKQQNKDLSDKLSELCKP